MADAEGLLSAGYHGTTMCLTALYRAERYEEPLVLLEHEKFWPYKRWSVRALAALGKKSVTIYVDTSPAAATPSGGKQTWSTEVGRNLVQFVEFPVESGAHRVTVRVPGCEPMETSVDVTPVDGAEIRGALRSSAPFVARGPAGNPDWGRIGVAVWLPGSIGLMQRVALPIVSNAGGRPRGC